MFLTSHLQTLAHLTHRQLVIGPTRPIGFAFQWSKNTDGFRTIHLSGKEYTPCPFKIAETK